MKLIKSKWCFLWIVSLCMLICFGFVDYQHKQHANASKTQLVMPKQKHYDRRYRIYTTHFLTVEHQDLEYLRTLGNCLASHTNNVYQTEYNGSHNLYHKYHDGNYWNIFHDQRTPSNFKRSHMNNATYRLIQIRVLRSHGVYHGVNYNSKRLPYEI